MGLGLLLRRAVALLVVAGLFAVLAVGISADDGNTEAVAARVLKPTQAIAEVPEKFNELFQIEWGGGSLYHLKARLATMGCMLNTIWAHDNNEWYAYNQYNVPHQLNQPFLTRFKGNISPAILYGSCINICTFDVYTGTIDEGKECETYEDLQNEIGRPLLEITPPIGPNVPCDQDFSSIVKQQVFPSLPILPNTCIINITMPYGVQKDRSGLQYRLGTMSSIIVFPEDASNYKEEDIDLVNQHNLHTEIHELCHVQQEYYVHQQFMPHQDNFYFDWYKTDAYKSFATLTGFKGIDDGLPENSIYKDIYSTNPIELSAELCTLLLLDRLGKKSGYSSVIVHHVDDSEYTFEEYEFDVSQYLTPPMVEWLETYMVLPEIAD